MAAYTNIRVAYQSLERATISMHTKRANKTDFDRKNKGDTVAHISVYENKCSIKNYDLSVVEEITKTHLPTIDEIIAHICSQSASVCKTSSISPALIILGECGRQLGDANGYTRLGLFDDKSDYAQISCYVINSLKDHIKCQELTSRNRSGFLIQWHEWRMCFVHIENKIAKSERSIKKYLNNFINKHGVNLIIGDFNFAPHKLKALDGVQNTYPDSKGKIAFAQQDLTAAEGTNSVNNRILDGIIATYDNAHNFLTENEFADLKAEKKILPLGLLSRSIPSSGDQRTLSAHAFTDHQGIVFDIATPYVSSESHKIAEKKKRSLRKSLHKLRIK